MAQHRTALGKTIDMGAFTAKHEGVRAVGNMGSINARGDTIDNSGRVVQSVNDKINEHYTATVHNPGATNVAASITAQQAPRRQTGEQSAAHTAPNTASYTAPQIDTDELSSLELEIENDRDDEYHYKSATEEKTKNRQGKK